MLALCIVLLLALNTSIMSMEHTLVQTSDKQLYSIPPHIAGFSNHLVEAQLWKKRLSILPSKPILLNSITKKQFDLFFKACKKLHKKKKLFYSFFNKLTLKQKNTLVSLTGQNKLNAPFLATVILNKYYPIISSIIGSYLSVDSITDYFYKKKISLISTKSHKTYYSMDSMEAQFNDHGNAYFVPMDINNQHNLFNGTVQPEDLVFPLQTLNDSPYMIHYKTTTGSSDNKTTYILASPIIDGRIQKNQICMFIQNEYDHIKLLHNLTCDNPVRVVATSKNGHYAVYQVKSVEKPYHTLTVAICHKKNNTYIHSKINFFLKYPISAIAFHPISTTLYITYQATSYYVLSVVEPETGQVLQKYFTKRNPMNMIIFSKSGSKILTCCGNYPKSSFWVWDASDPKKLIRLFRTQIFDIITPLPAFDNTETTLVIPTKNNSFYFIDTNNGHVITQTSEAQASCSSITHILFPPNHTICLTNSSSLGKMNLDNTNIWDSKTGKLLSSLLSCENNTRGIGFYNNGKAAITLYNDFSINTTILLTNDDFACLELIKKKASCLQLYALYHIYTYYEHNEEPPFLIKKHLKLLPQTIRKFIKKCLKTK